MARSGATMVAADLAQLPSERRSALARVRAGIRKHLPAGYRGTMNWGMITYEVPVKRYPNTCNGQPLLYAALAAQKEYLAIYLMGACQDPALTRVLNDGFRTATRNWTWATPAFAFAGRRTSRWISSARWSRVLRSPSSSRRTRLPIAVDGGGCGTRWRSE